MRARDAYVSPFSHGEARLFFSSLPFLARFETPVGAAAMKLR